MRYGTDYQEGQAAPAVRRLLVIGLGSSTCLYTAIAHPSKAAAQISGDGSLGTLVNGSLTDSCAIALCTITGGTINQTGSTLLHSFDQFTTPEEAPSPSVLFTDPGVSDIVVRVTGGNQSFLNSTISTSAGSTANLFLVNPSGITFGTNAQLDIGGSFLASTANNILFDNGISLSASNPTPPSSELLTVSAPIGLGFLPNSSGTIQVKGTGNRLTFGSPEPPDLQFVNRIFQQPLPPDAPFPPLPPLSEVAVRPNQTLSLVANGIALDGGNLAASGGQIQLGSIASGTVLIDPSSSLNYDQVSQFADIALTNRSTLEVSAPIAGNIQIDGDNISVLNSSAILAETLASAPSQTTAPGRIDISATGDVEVSGFTLEPEIPLNPRFFSYLSVDTAPGASGSGGQLSLQAQSISINSGGQLSATTFGSGDGGQININTKDTTTLIGGSPFGPSGLFAVADSVDGSNSNSGQIFVKAGRLQMSEGAQISTISFTPGIAGLIEVTAEQINLTGTSPPVEIGTEQAPRQIVSPTTIRSEMTAPSIGKGNPIRLSTNNLTVSEGAEIVTVTSGAGTASDIEIKAADITVSGRAALGEEGPSSIFTFVSLDATGRGGDLDVATERLQLLESGQVGTTTAGLGQAGDLSVEATESVTITGQTPLGRSGLFANAINRTGAGGNLFVNTQNLSISKGGTLNVSNFPSGSNAQLPPGQGDAGNLQVNARQISLSEAGIISADTAAGDRGNITLNTQALTLRQNSRITANATGSATGGNININAPNGVIIAVPEENSDITANAVFGDGGRINITAQSVLGIEPRAQLTPLSDITTSSEFGLDGETRLETLDPEIRTEETPLPQSTDIPLVAQGCSATSNSSRFVQSGSSGLASSPYDSFSNQSTLSDTSLPPSLSTNSQTTAPNAPQNRSDAQSMTIAEAKTWNTNPQGEVVLLAADFSEADRCASWK